MIDTNMKTGIWPNIPHVGDIGLFPVSVSIPTPPLQGY